MKLDTSAFVADQELIQELANRSLPIVCGENRVLFHQGDAQAGLYILDRGVVTLTKSASQGQKVASTQACAGSIFGLPALIFNEPANRTVIARKGAEVSFVTRADFNHLAETDPRFSLLHVLAKEIRSLSKMVLRSKATIAVAKHLPKPTERKGRPQITLCVPVSPATGL
jgi:CRP-like cAMP-binding protein